MEEDRNESPQVKIEEINLNFGTEDSSRTDLQVVQDSA